MMHKIDTLLLRLGGARPDAIGNVPHEALLYRILGCLLFATALIASATTAHASELYLHSWFAAAGVGLVIGTFILLVDAAMVQLLKRQETWWKTVLAAAPRYAVSLVLGLAIAVPGVMGAFNDSISFEAQKIKDEKFDQGIANLAASGREIDGLEDQRDELVAASTQINLGGALARSPEHRIQARRVASLRRQAAAAYARANCERDGNCGSGKAGVGPSFLAKQAQADAINDDYEQAKARLAEIDDRLSREEGAAGKVRVAHARSELPPLEKRIDDLAKRRDQREESLYDAYRKPLDPLDRLGGLMGLIENDTRMRAAILFVFLVILTLDTAPVNIKISSLIGKKTEYELVLGDLREELKADIESNRKRREAAAAVEDKRVIESRKRQEKIQSEEARRLEEKYRSEIRKILDQGFETWKQTELRDSLAKAAHLRTPAQPPKSTSYPASGPRP